MVRQAVQESMQKSVIGMKNKGFTLIEIMIVVVIIGITLGFALIAFGDFGKSKRILFAAEQLVNQMQLAQQQAVILTETIGLKITPNNYQFMRLDNNVWAVPQKNTLFKLTAWPEDTSLQLNAPTTSGPQIIFNASGNMTPFNLTLSANKGVPQAIIIGSNNGSLELKRLAADEK